jgi:hypothetical protein
MGSRLFEYAVEEIIWTVTGLGLNFGICFGRVGLWWCLTSCGELHWNLMSILKCSCMNCVYGKGNQDHVVSIVARLQAEQLRDCISVSSRYKECFTVTKCPDWCWVAFSLLCTRYKGVVSPGLMWPGHEADYSTPSSSEDKNVFAAVPPLPPCDFIVFTVQFPLLSIHSASLLTSVG